MTWVLSHRRAPGFHPDRGRLVADEQWGNSTLRSRLVAVDLNQRTATRGQPWASVHGSVEAYAARSSLGRSMVSASSCSLRPSPENIASSSVKN